MEKKNILPIVGYGNAVLRTKAKEVAKNSSDVRKLIPQMFETMYGASGVGLAAPQIEKSLRLFVADASPFAEDKDIDEHKKEALKNFKGVFINPHILEETGEPWAFEEGCLSLPEIRAKVLRKPVIRVKYLDENFQWQEQILDGIPARIFQHEYDHLEGILFINKISPLKKRLLEKKLIKIKKAKITADYPMVFAR